MSKRPLLTFPEFSLLIEVWLYSMKSIKIYKIYLCLTESNIEYCSYHLIILFFNSIPFSFFKSFHLFLFFYSSFYHFNLLSSHLLTFYFTSFYFLIHFIFILNFWYDHFSHYFIKYTRNIFNTFISISLFYQRLMLIYIFKILHLILTYFT